MAYDPEVSPSLITQAIGGPSGLRWFALTWVDPIADVLAPGYISNAFDIGLRAGDGLIYKDVNRGEWDHYDLICLEVDAETGAATVAFPEVPEEALPLEADFDPDDAASYAVMYIGGRQVRVDTSGFGDTLVPIASQAEAEAGAINTKRMTPIRTRQAIDERTRIEAPNVIQGGAIATGLSATQDAINAQLAQTGKLAVPDGLYMVSSPILVNKSNSQLSFSRGAFILPGGDDFAVIDVRGEAPSSWTALSSNAAAEDDEISTATDPGWAVGDWIEIRSDALISGPNEKAGKISRLRKITSMSGAGPYTFRLNANLLDDYLIADSAEAGRAAVVENVTIDGAQINVDDFTSLAAIGIRVEYAANVRIINPRIVGTKERNGADIEGRSAISILRSCGVEIAGLYANSIGWYGVSIVGATECVKVFGGLVEDARHAVSVVWVEGYGEPDDILIYGMTGRNTNLSAFDTHDTGRNIRFDNCLAEGSRDDAGFQIRNLGTQLLNSVASGNALDGVVVRVGAADFTMRNCKVEKNGRRGINAAEPITLSSSEIINNGRGVSGQLGVAVVGGEISNTVVTGNASTGNVALAIDLSANPTQSSLKLNSVDLDGVISAQTGATLEFVEMTGCRLPLSRLAICYTSSTVATDAGRAAPRVSKGNAFRTGTIRGVATLVAGEATVTCDTAFANTDFSSSPNIATKIELTRVAPGGTRGALYVNNVSSLTSFVVRSTSNTDTSTFMWEVTL